MYNLHSHTLLSDGVLLPSELCVRYAALGYKAIAITDHADYSNIDSIISALRKFCSKLPKNFPLKVLPGVELTHLPLNQFKPLAAYCRANGVKIIIGHGETVSEPVVCGTNRACLESDIDILAHPGHISDQDVKFAAKRGIFLELTTRKSHGRTNREVAAKALKWNAKLILNHDSHGPCDILSPEQTKRAAIRSAAITAARVSQIIRQTSLLVNSK
jgi:putative hydrolase